MGKYPESFSQVKTQFPLMGNLQDKFPWTSYRVINRRRVTQSSVQVHYKKKSRHSHFPSWVISINILAVSQFIITGCWELRRIQQWQLSAALPWYSVNHVLFFFFPFSFFWLPFQMAKKKKNLLHLEALIYFLNVGGSFPFYIAP